MRSKPSSKEIVHAFEVQVELLVKIWRHVVVMGLEVLVLIASEEP
jgi:hypothetical protein